MDRSRAGAPGSARLSRARGLRLAALMLGGVLVGSLCGVIAAAPAQAAASITVNGSSGGRTFDGVGAISGGGGNSRLLIDYPETQRNQILDYLFKPGYGAAIQLLKLEIGGDTNSTSGAEPSHEHVRGAVNCNRGYEWWLAGEARKRNPNVKLVGLAWGAPGWIGSTFFTNDAISYLTGWLDCAKSHGLTIDYLGGWNEKGTNANWYINLRSAMNSRGYSGVKIVASDNFGWPDADISTYNQAFKNAVAVFGAHYVCGYRSAQTSCPSSNNAINSGKQLWASENGSDDYNDGAPAMARGINRGYIDGRMVGYLNWPLLAAITPNVPWATMGVAVAPQPWSGAYSIGKSAWVMAHTTQFTAPGWRYLDSSVGYLNGQRGQGSYVSLRSPNSNDYSVILETADASSAQQINVNVTGGLSTGQVHVWQTNLRSGSSSNFFVRGSDLNPSNGSFSFTAQPGYLYSLTTTTGQGKGTATSPSTGSLALPYSDDFDSYALASEAKYLMDHQGSFEVVGCGSGRSGQCIRQMSENTPIYWTEGKAEPFTLLGDLGWRDYTVSSDFMLERSGYAQLIGRAGNYPHQAPQSLNSYYLRITDGGNWAIRANNTSNNVRTLASGTTSAPGTGRWHNFALTFSGSSITAYLDGQRLGSATDYAFGNGQVGYGTGTAVAAQFDNLAITPGTTTTTTGGNAGNGSLVTPGGKCLGVSGTSNGSTAQIQTCNGSAGQSWSFNSDRTLRTLGGTMCLDAYGEGTTNGTSLIIWTCHGQANQQWTQGSSNNIVGAASGRCVDVPNGSTTDGTNVQLYDCWGGDPQSWTFNGGSTPTTTTTQPPTTTTPTTTTTTTTRTTTITTTTTQQPTNTTTTTTQQPTTTTTSGSGGGPTCSATYTVIGSWGSGFQGDVKVNNTGGNITSWNVTLSLPSGASITSLWNGVASGSSGTVRVSNAPYNGALGSGASTSFGFTANGPASPVPGVTCSAAGG